MNQARNECPRHGVREACSCCTGCGRDPCASDCPYSDPDAVLKERLTNVYMRGWHYGASGQGPVKISPDQQTVWMLGYGDGKNALDIARDLAKLAAEGIIAS